MKSEEIRKQFLNFFEKRGHTIVPSSSLIPDDPSVLLTTAGMQQFKPYYKELDPTTTVHPSIGKPVGKKAASVQKSFRTSDIDEVGDERHLTFFEMLGNFSFGGYFKKEAIEYAYHFLTDSVEEGGMGLKIDYVTIFEGKENIGVPKDEESKNIWLSLNQNLKVVEQGMDDVFWGPTGASGPCGPTAEIYIKPSEDQEAIEVWNIVFNQYFYPGSREELNTGVAGKKLESLPTPGVDTGMGLERLVMVKQGVKNVFETDLFQPLIQSLPSAWTDERIKRILSDHSRAIVFLIADGIVPNNKGAGYILRRLIRRAIVHLHAKQGTSFSSGDTLPMGIENDMTTLLKTVIDQYNSIYPELKEEKVFSVFKEELRKFGSVLKQGLREMKKNEVIDARAAFRLYESYGLPFEVIKDFGGEHAQKLLREDFDKEFAKHQEISRAGQEKKFGGHGLLLDTGELKAANEEELKKVTRLHTATHMLQQALREVLGPEVHQAGSDITVERTRFDFTYPRKLTPEEIKEVENKVNEKIKEDLPMQKVVLPKSEAEKTGALYFFREKYPDPVNVYFVGETLETAWSKEFCGGPHVEHTGQIGAFKIAKEEATSAGVRRIRGIIEP